MHDLKGDILQLIHLRICISSTNHSRHKPELVSEIQEFSQANEQLAKMQLNTINLKSIMLLSLNQTVETGLKENIVESFVLRKTF